MLKELMISLGYDESNIDRMRSTYPVNKCGDDYLYGMIPKILKLFVDFGYTKKQILKITMERPHIFCYELDVVSSKIDYYVKLFGDKEIVIKVATDFPTIFSYDIKTIDTKIDELKKIGYKKNIIIKNIKKYPEILGFSIEDNIKIMIGEFQKFGFCDSDILKITSKNMSIFGRDKKRVSDVVEKYEKLGYSRKDIISMSRKHPQIFNYDLERIDERIEFLVSSGIDYNDVLNVFKLNPALIGDAKDTFENKKVFYDSIGLVDIFVKEPKNLIQGIAKSYARYMHFQNIGVNIYETEKSYKKLFIGESRFESTYRVKSSDLIKIYDVKEYMRNCKKRKLG